MGDSDITLYLSSAANLVVIGAIAAFVIAWLVRKRAVRIAVGMGLLVAAAFCGILSLSAALFVAALGIAVLVLAGKTPRGVSLATKEETDQ